MKKLYSTFILAFIVAASQLLQAQPPYHKMIASNYTDWYIFQAYIPVKHVQNVNSASFSLSQGKYSAYTDTTVLGLNYKKMYHEYYSPGFNNHMQLGYLREDTIARKVYFLDKNSTTEDLLYDFSLTVGSTTPLNFPGTFGAFPNSTYTVVTIDSVMTRVGYRKQLNLLATNSDTLKYIESIGSIAHPLYLYGYFNTGQFSFQGPSTCYYPYDLGLACKESNNQKFFQSCTYDLALMNGCIYEYDSCNYYNSCSGLNELTKDLKFNLSPNPAIDKTTLEIDMISDETTTIGLFDITGRNMKTIFNGNLSTGKHNIQIDLSHYNNGYYFIKVSGKGFNANQPIVISR